MKKSIILFLAAAFLSITALQAYINDCGNPVDPCIPCETGNSVGTNPINP